MSGKGKQSRKSGGKPAASKGSGGKGSGKQNTSIASNSSANSSLDNSDSKDLAVSFPLIKIADNSRLLPRYATILSRNAEEGVCMEDIDSLQLELEALLSATALRIRALTGEVGAINSAEEKRDKKFKPASPGKRGGGKIIDERIVKKAKDTNGKPTETVPAPVLKFTKVKNAPGTYQASTSTAIPAVDIIEPEPSEVPPPAPPKNDASNKFWASVEPYCSEITTSDVQVVKDLIAVHEAQTTNITIPPLGKHYSTTWLQDDVADEAVASNAEKRKQSKDANETEKLLKKIEKRTEIAAPGSMTQRVVCALIEDNHMPPMDPTNGETLQSARAKLTNGLSMTHSAQLEVQMRKELLEQGLLDPDDENPIREQEDEILIELKKCQEELKRLNQHNVGALNRLLNLANEEVARQDLRRKLNLIDMQIVDAYKKLGIIKQKRKPLSKKDKEPTWKLLRERDSIIKQLDASATKK